MGWEYRIDTDRGVVLGEFYGDIAADDFIGFWAAIVQHPDFALELPRLYRFDRVTTPLSYEDLRAANWQLRSSRVAPAGRLALVAGRDVVYGSLRAFQMLSERPEVTYGVFRTVAEAEAWLGLPPAGSPPQAAQPLP